jgi:hypothetical protein
MSQSENRILNSLPQNIFVALEPHLKTASLRFGEIVAETDPARHSRLLPAPLHYLSRRRDGSRGHDRNRHGGAGRGGQRDIRARRQIGLHRGIIQVAGDASVIDPDTTLRLQQNSSSSNRLSSSDGDLSDPVSFTRHALREVQEVPRMSQLAGPGERASLDEVLQVARRGGA